MNRQVLRTSGALALSALLVASALPADAGGAARTRPHSRGSSSSGSSHASAPADGRGAARAQGHATYGYGHGNFGYRPYYWDWYYGPWWLLGSWWGWPGSWGDAWWYGRPGWYPGAYAGDDAEGIAIGPAIVETAIRPKRAQVILDGDPIGQARDFNGTWDVLEIDPGRHLLVFEAPGYKTLEVGIDVRPGRNYRVAYLLREGEGKDPRSTPLPPPAPPSDRAPSTTSALPPVPAEPDPGGERTGLARGFLRIEATPPDAAVYLDGEFLGRGDELARLHGALPVAAGEHRIEVVRPGYRSRTDRVDVSEGQPPAVIRVVLDREGGSAL